MADPYASFSSPAPADPYAAFASPADAAPAAPAGPSGIGANIKAGLMEGATGLAQGVLDSANPAHIALALAAKVPGAAEAAMRFFGHTPTKGELAALHAQTASIKMLDPTPDIAPKIAQATGYDPSQTTAATLPEKIARGVAQAAPGAVLPVGEGYSLQGLIKQAPSIIGAGVGGPLAQELVPADAPPEAAEVANQIGSAVGGIAPHASVAAVGAAGRALPEGVKTTAGQIAAGASQGAAEQQAAQVLASRASDPGAAAVALADNGEIVPRSQPTTFQQTGDTGLGQLEREQATKHQGLFNDRRAEQGAARTEAISDIQQGADPNDVAKTLKAQFDDLDKQTQADVDAATAKAQAAHDAAVRGAQATYDARDAAHQGSVDAATATAQAQAAALGGASTPEAYGNTLRSAVDQAHEAARARDGALFKAIDPNEDLTANVAHTAQGAEEIAGKVSSVARPMEGEEAAIFQTAADMPHLSPLSDLIDLRTRVNNEMRVTRLAGNAEANRRLTMLRGVIEHNLSHTIAEQIAQENSAVARGEMAGDNTILSRLQDWENDWRAQRGGSGGDNPVPDTGGTTGRGPSQDGAGFPPARGFGSSAGDQGISPRPIDPTAATGLIPTVDDAAKARIDQATASVKERKQTFGAQPVATVLKDTGAKGQFALPDGQVPSKFFHSGPKAFTDIQALVKAAGESVIPTLVDYAAMMLRRAALEPDGTLDPAKFTRWRVQHADALRALPAEARDRFANAATAGQALRDAEAGRTTALKAGEADRRSAVRDAEATRDAKVLEAQRARTVALKDAQAGAIGKVMGLTEPEDVTKTVGAILNGRTAVADMKALAKATAGNPEARAGLRQAVADHITQKLMSNTEAGTTGVVQLKADQFQTFMKTSTPALNLIFKPDEIALMKAVAADLQRANRSVNTKAPGQSNTAQDLTALKKSPLVKHGKTMLATLAGGVGLAAHGAAGGLTGVFGLLIAEHLHSVGVTRIDQLVTEAMLHPAVARRLLSKVPPEGAKQAAAMQALGRGIVRSLAVSVAPQTGQSPAN